MFTCILMNYTSSQEMDWTTPSSIVPNIEHSIIATRTILWVWSLLFLALSMKVIKHFWESQNSISNRKIEDRRILLNETQCTGWIAYIAYFQKLMKRMYQQVTEVLRFRWGLLAGPLICLTIPCTVKFTFTHLECYSTSFNINPFHPIMIAVFSAVNSVTICKNAPQHRAKDASIFQYSYPCFFKCYLSKDLIYSTHIKVNTLSFN